MKNKLKMVEKYVFLKNPKLQYLYLNEENVFIVPNLEKKEDNYVNPCLPKSMNE